jgi:hypothetical protein
VVNLRALASNRLFSQSGQTAWYVLLPAALPSMRVLYGAHHTHTFTTTMWRPCACLVLLPTIRYIAAQNGRAEVVHVLVQAKASVHTARNKDGCTPFYAAADKGFCEILTYLAEVRGSLVGGLVGWWVGGWWAGWLAAG